MADQKNMLTIAEAVLHLHQITLYRLLKRGELPGALRAVGSGGSTVRGWSGSWSASKEAASVKK